MKRNRRVKILATLGPSSSDKAMIKSLFLAGADVFRINMSHTSHDNLRRLVSTIRDVETEISRPIGILIDLQGPKLRVGTFADGPIQLGIGDIFVLDSDETPGSQDRVHLPHPEILSAVKVGDRLLLDDGRVRLTATETTGKAVTCRVETGGKLSNKKGVSLPDTLIDTSAMTPKDRADLDAALQLEVDWIALSFVQRPDDIAELRKIVRGKCGVLAKMEKPQAMERLDEILDLSDALMVARGDLGVEMPLEAVPGLQKQMTRAARRAGKPVVVATQMLESMISAPVPTRAEVSDVASAVYEGADAIMLSAESAAGDFPQEAVAMMNAIAEQVEKDPNFSSIIHAQRTEPEATGADAISAAARQIGETLNLPAIVCFTSSGATGLRASRERPLTPIIATSPVIETVRRLSLVWGLHCVLSADATNEQELVDIACRIASDDQFATQGQRIIVTAGVPFGTPGSTNLLRIVFVGTQGMADL